MNGDTSSGWVSGFRWGVLSGLAIAAIAYLVSFGVDCRWA